jgi:tetracycline resistance efflux pump
MTGTFWAVLPPIIAIVLALITKEVYLSLMVGIASGALMFTGFHPIKAMDTVFSIMATKIGENCDILVFLVLLGILVALITKSGASRAYGKWASKAIRTKRQALLATVCLGVVIFVDDYFNCLTVGTVMRPVTDKYKITRAKLAYVIDATAAPVCIIAPISSWAAAVGSSLPKGSNIDGFSLFIRAIPFNYYALLTLVFLMFLIISNVDYSKMRQYEISHMAEKLESVKDDEIEIVGHGKVKDLILPILFLIGSCIGFMLYTGGLFEGASIIDAFANCSSARSLVLGSFLTLIFTFILYIPRKVIAFVDFCGSFVQGFKAMTSAIMILCLAWSLSGICSQEYLNIQGFVKGAIGGSTMAIIVMPVIFFLIALGLAFATGTSWGTFGILIPISVTILGGDMMMMAVCVGAILAGAVCGDHISPISDTTILSSAGAQCVHIDHVSTQMPYAFTVAACAVCGYIAAGVTSNGYIGLFAAFICLMAAMAVIFSKAKRSA